MLTAEQLKARDNRITASQVGILMSGDEAKILGLWKMLLGLQEPTDLSGVWPVRLGEATEQLNLDWYEFTEHREVGRRGEVVIGNPDWMACTLDGWDMINIHPVECKHVGGREPIETIIARYQPQLHWQMMCTYAKRCALSVIMGANEPIIEMIEFDEAYAKELMARASSFMLCLETLTPPVAAPEVKPPVQQIKRYDMSESNAWTNYAIVWLRSKGEAEQHAMATKELKALVPDDASAAHGHGVIITRDRAGRMSLREAK